MFNKRKPGRGCIPIRALSNQETAMSDAHDDATKLLARQSGFIERRFLVHSTVAHAIAQLAFAGRAAR